MELRGPRGVRGIVAAYYRAALPAHAAAAAQAWDQRIEVPVSDPDDARKDGYFPHDPPAIDRWPMLSVNSGRVRQSEVDYTDDGEPVYRLIYPIRVFTWVRGNDRPHTQGLRDDLATAVRVTALADPTLGTDGSARVDVATIVTDFSRIEPVKGDRHVAGSYVGFDLHVHETLTDRLALPGGQPRDTVSGVNVTATRLHDEED